MESATASKDSLVSVKNQQIDSWLEERESVLKQYCALAGLLPFETHTALPPLQQINAFCEVLMDYISAGHFNIYKITESVNHCCERDGKVAALLQDIQNTTDKALSFNDLYVQGGEGQGFSQFDQHLSVLGETLEERFEKEDSLVRILYQNIQFSEQ
jgi:regulator of sigma D